MKKSIAFIFAALFAAVSFAATETVNGVTWKYSISNGKATIGTGSSSAAIWTSTSGALVIPSTLGGCPVTTIGDWAFEGCSSLTSVTIPESVTTIGDCAFSGCIKLQSFTVAAANPFYCTIDGILYTKDRLTLVACPGAKTLVTIPEGVTTIGESAFFGCSSLASVTIPDSVKTIGDYAFNGCSSMKEIIGWMPGCPRNVERIVISDSVTTIEGSAFSYCSSLTSVTIPDSVTTIGSWAFRDCSSLKSVTIPDSVTTIESGAFYGCSSLTSVTIPNSVTTIESSAFYGCSSLESVTIPEGVTTIGDGAFFGCSSLTSVTIPSSVTTIGGCVFAGCRSLVSVIIPDSITGFGTGAFRDCCDLVRVDIRNVKSWCAISFGDEDANPLYYARRLYLNDKEVVVLEIPEETQTINEYAFCNCSFIERVVVPNSVTHIDSKAFLGCENVRDVELPSRWILSSIFPDSYKNLLKVVVSKGCVSILDSMFKGCTGLESVIIPGSVLKMGNSVFYDCASLKDVVFEGDAPECGADTFYGTPKRVVVSVPNGSIGWSGGVTDRLPEIWEGRLIAHTGDAIEWPTIIAGGTSMALTSVTVTNVVVHYVLNSVQPEFAKPVSEDTGFVNVIAEVKGMSVAVPQTWAENYPEFAAKFGSDFTKALTMKSGKIAAGGREMLVWEDYVAGTDPTDPNDKFTATMMMVNGKPVISWTPELDSDRAAMRTYTTYGKRSLLDSDWEVVPVGQEANYNFFKVSVEMR